MSHHQPDEQPNQKSNLANIKQWIQPQRCVTGNIPQKADFQRQSKQVNIYLPSDESKWKYLHHRQPATAHNKQGIKHIYAPKDLLFLKIIPGKVGILQYCRWQACFHFHNSISTKKISSKKPSERPAITGIRAANAAVTDSVFRIHGFIKARTGSGVMLWKLMASSTKHLFLNKPEIMKSQCQGFPLLGHLVWNRAENIKEKCNFKPWQ